MTCSVRNCNNDSEILLRQHNCELCEIHWSEYCDGVELHLKHGRAIQTAGSIPASISRNSLRFYLSEEVGK